jgi:hypothetical protein
MSLGLALIVTVFPVGTRIGTALFAPRAATGARIAAAAFFLVCVAALAELRGRRPGHHEAMQLSTGVYPPS